VRDVHTSAGEETLYYMITVPERGAERYVIIARERCAHFSRRRNAEVRE